MRGDVGTIHPTHQSSLCSIGANCSCIRKMEADLMRAVIHFINRWGRTKDRLGDLKQKQQELINKSKDLLPPPPPGDNGNGSAVATTPPPGDGVPRPIDVSMNGSQPQQPAEPTGPQAQRPHQPPQQPQPQPQDQVKGADENG